MSYFRSARLSTSTVGLVAILLGVMGCSSAELGLETAQQCSTHTDCPPSQVCESHSCTATCLTGVLCPVVSEQGIAGSVLVTEHIAANSAESQVIAQAAFQHAESLLTSPKMYFPGSDCVAVPSQQLSLPPGLNLGPIALSGGLTLDDVKSASDLGQGTAQVFPESKENGTVYYADLSQGLRLTPEKTVSAKALGNDSSPHFEVKVDVPKHFASVQVEPAFVFAGQNYHVQWTAENAAQVVVQIHGTALSEGDSVPMTIVCPSRDESGHITVPKDATAMLAKGPVTVSLIRQNVAHTVDSSGTFFAKAGFSYSWNTTVK